METPLSDLPEPKRIAIETNPSPIDRWAALIQEPRRKVGLLL